MSREVKNDAVEDRNVYLDEICTAIDTNFNTYNSRQAYRITRMFQMKKSSFESITKDGQGNILSVEKRLKILREHICETQEYPTQRPGNITAEEIQHYYRQFKINFQICSTVSCNIPSKKVSSTS
eukprot:snap_masked-scaffold_2-processed-gene-5.30-mRNA-1 protein AED:1.00 eAED:1.00 QI:0/-1/0/0/-1/1/1/0/124